jgi:hypothetical protein
VVGCSVVSGCGVLTLVVNSSCNDPTQTPSLHYRRFGNRRQGLEVFEGVDGVFGGKGGVEISGFGGGGCWLKGSELKEQDGQVQLKI